MLSLSRVDREQKSSLADRAKLVTPEPLVSRIKKASIEGWTSRGANREKITSLLLISTRNHATLDSSSWRDRQSQFHSR